MSGGTPVGGRYMRQRHSQGYASSGDDLEDDACSRPRPLSPASPRSRTWIEILENFLWLASATFTMYCGDRHSNLIYLLWHDDRIRRLNAWLPSLSSLHPYLSLSLSCTHARTRERQRQRQRLAEAHTSIFESRTIIGRVPLYLGMVGVSLNAIILFYSSTSVWSVRRFDEKWKLTSHSALPFVTFLGLVSFCLFSFALWPIWSFLTLPLLFTLFMACMVIFPHILIGASWMHVRNNTDIHEELLTWTWVVGSRAYKLRFCHH